MSPFSQIEIIIKQKKKVTVKSAARADVIRDGSVTSKHMTCMLVTQNQDVGPAQNDGLYTIVV